jgi:hypothetical protein
VLRSLLGPVSSHGYPKSHFGTSAEIALANAFNRLPGASFQFTEQLGVRFGVDRALRLLAEPACVCARMPVITAVRGHDRGAGGAGVRGPKEFFG